MNIITFQNNNYNYIPKNKSDKNGLEKASLPQNPCYFSLSTENYNSFYLGKLKRINNGVSFKTCLDRTKLTEIPAGNQLQTCYHDTIFFRDSDTLECMKNYLNDNFPDGAHIADFGCSVGEETRSIVMMLDDINKDKKYTITGFDVVDSKITDAKKGLYTIPYKNSDMYDYSFISYYDDFLLKDTNQIRQSNKILYKKLFDKFFTKIGETKNKEIRSGQYSDVANFKANDELFEDIINFKPGNLFEIDKLLKPYNEIKPPQKNTACIIAKNTLYHMTGNTFFSYPNEYNLDAVKTTIEKIDKILPKSGILVVGSFVDDHLFDEFPEEDGPYCSSPFHKLLLEKFTPLPDSYRKCTGLPEDYKYREIIVPTIWVKK